MIWLKKILTAFALVLLLASCERYDVNEILLSRDDISLTWKADPQIVYEPYTWQLGFNAARNEFRVNDDSMANYFVLRCDGRPSAEGQEVTASVEWTQKSSVKRYEGLKFEVEKVGRDGYVWLWNRSQKIGVTVRLMD